MVRFFRFSDISKLNKFRNNGIFPHNSPTLTWGQGLVIFRAAISFPGNTTGAFTALDEDPMIKIPVFAQAVHHSGARAAHFTFCSPGSAVRSPAFNRLIEFLITKLGEHSAQSIMAEVDHDFAIFEALREGNFSEYTHQQIWKIKTKPALYESDIKCRRMAGLDTLNAHAMYSRIVPQFNQSVETGPLNRIRGVVCYRGDELAGYADVSEGPRGVWVQPFIPVNESEPGLLVSEILNMFSPHGWRPIYLCQRTYQSHLNQLLQDMGAEPGPKQAVMVRRLTSSIKKPALSPIPQINGSREATTPYSRPINNTEKQ